MLAGIFSEPPDWVSATTYSAGAKVKYNNVYWTALVGSNTGNQPGIDLTKWAINANGATVARVVVSQLIGGNEQFTGADMSTKLKLLGVDVASVGDSTARTPGARRARGPR